MKATGIDTSTSNRQERARTIDKLKQAVASGQIRRFTGTDDQPRQEWPQTGTSRRHRLVRRRVSSRRSNPEHRVPNAHRGIILWSDTGRSRSGPQPAGGRGVHELRSMTRRTRSTIAAYTSLHSRQRGPGPIQTTNPDLVNGPDLPDGSFPSKCTPARPEGPVGETFTRASRAPEQLANWIRVRRDD